MIGIQRSRGYDWRASFTVAEIGEMVRRVKAWKPDVIVFVDNCYGEFTEELEPTEVGVDLMAGSLIKNPGGGLAPTGGYIAGNETCGRADRVPADRTRHRRRGWSHARHTALDVSRVVPCTASGWTSA